MTEIVQNQKSNQKMNLLLVGRDFSLYDALKTSTLNLRWNILFARAEEDILSAVKRHQIHVVLAEIKKSKREATLLLKQLKKFDSFLEVIMTGPLLVSE